MPVADVAASFQEAVADVLTRKAVDACLAQGVDHLVISGGVAANSRLRALAQERCDAAGIRLRVPRPGLCTDNGAMVAALGSDLVAAGAEPSARRLRRRLRPAGHPGPGRLTAGPGPSRHAAASRRQRRTARTTSVYSGRLNSPDEVCGVAAR